MDKIKIRDLEVYARHGVYPEETALGQKFLVSLVMETDTRAAGKADDLSKSVDYGKVAHDVERFLTKNTYRLLEAAAEHLAEELLLGYPQVNVVTVEIKKPWAPVLLPLETVAVEIVRRWHEVYLSIGSNMGDKEKNLENALDFLRNDPKIRVVQVSEFLVTKPYGYTEQDDFLNGAVRIDTLYTPEELLGIIHEAEADGGRERKIRWGPRTIDLDILFYDDEIISEPDLVIPHREIQKREFVLKPLSLIAAWKEHPVFHKSVMELLEMLEAEGESP
jgi:dihydroneopterin aldolase/2-amino-4-hydroxy-6-hydroxymethyldihydropteridine diphosphokinase